MELIDQGSSKMEDFYDSLDKFRTKPSQTASFVEKAPNESVRKKAIPQRSTGYTPPITKKEKILQFAQPLDANGEYSIHSQTKTNVRK